MEATWIKQNWVFSMFGSSFDVVHFAVWTKTWQPWSQSWLLRAPFITRVIEIKVSRQACLWNKPPFPGKGQNYVEQCCVAEVAWVTWKKKQTEAQSENERCLRVERAFSSLLLKTHLLLCLIQLNLSDSASPPPPSRLVIKMTLTPEVQRWAYLSRAARRLYNDTALKTNKQTLGFFSLLPRVQQTSDGSDAGT